MDLGHDKTIFCLIKLNSVKNLFLILTDFIIFL